MFPAVLLLLLALATPAFAAPSVDRSGSAGDPRVSAALERLRNDPALNRLARVAHIDERYGVPSFVWSNALPAPRPGTTREAAARAHLASLGPLYGLDQRDAREANLRHVHDTGRGAIVASFTQRVGGIDVFLDEINVLMDRSLRPLAVSGYIPSQASTIRGRFRLSAAAALDRALADFGGAAQLTPGHDPRTRKVLFHAGASLVPGWHLELAGPTQAYSYVISAEDGDLLFRNSLMASDVFGYRVWADATPAHEPFDGPQGTTPTPHPTGTPDVYTPPFLAPSLISLQNSPFSMNDPWLPSGATQTTGNNVDAYADLASPDGFGAGDLRATTTSPGVFDRSYDPTQAPGVSANQRMAAITQLFYTINYLHDWYYDAGFNEGAGNAQADNYGRGGVGGDRILAEAQDYSGTNNANMFTPGDGASPRMQMYPFTPATAGVVVSGPGISGSRLAGTASFGPQAFNITGSLVLVADGTAPTSDGCSAILNSITGRIALIDRGDCNFSNKAQNAQSAGAIGVVIVDNVEGFVPPLMGGNDPTITIPVLSITKALGDSLKVALGSGPVTLTLDRPAEPWRDGSIDNQIVAHEWGHYISNRVAGGLTNAMGQGMGEGWGDFHAMLMTVRPEDASAPGNTDFGGVYSLSGYAMGGLYSQSYYFGIRRVPYSTDMTKDPFTFQHISDAVTLPPGIPYQIFSTQNSQVHNTGEIWCTMLWECYAALLRDTGRLTFDQARLRMRDYLVAAYQMTPNAPTLTEARDALLAVAAANDAADYVLFWQAFAKRGAGMNAVSPDRNSTTHTPVVESYVAGGDVRFVSLSVVDDFISCDQDGYLDEGEIGTLTVTVQNTGAISLNATTGTASSSNPAISFPDGATLTFSPSTPMGLATATLKIKLQGSSGLEAANIQVSFGDAAQVTPQPVVASRNLYVRADAVPSATESAEPATLPWTNDGSSSGADGAFQRLELTPTSHVVFGPDPDGISDQRFESPDLHVAPAGNFVFTFTHKFSFERAGATRYDGGVVEISSDGGQTWTDVNTHGATPGYNGTITNTSGNPLGGRQGYTGTNTGYPSTVLATVNLGTTFAGQTVRVRFRVGTDQAVGAPGWQIDNIAFTNITNTPFLALQSDDPCAPTAVGDAPPTELAFAIEGSMPVRGDVHMRFALPKAGPVEIAVFDVAGRRLETLANGRFDSGIHSLEWKPNGQSGSGVYFVRMSAAGRSLVRRIVALR